MPSIAWIAIALATIAAASLLGLRWLDTQHDESVWRSLVVQAGPSRGIYDPGLVDDLPEPARRYFNFSIAPGTPLVTAVELEMQGELGLGTITEPKYTPMSAHQVLAPPHGFVWRVRLLGDVP